MRSIIPVFIAVMLHVIEGLQQLPKAIEDSAEMVRSVCCYVTLSFVQFQTSEKSIIRACLVFT
jgi:hypothetical protein